METVSEPFGFSVISCLPLLSAAAANSELLAQLGLTMGFGTAQMWYSCITEHPTHPTNLPTGSHLLGGDLLQLLLGGCSPGPAAEDSWMYTIYCCCCWDIVKNLHSHLVWITAHFMCCLFFPVLSCLQALIEWFLLPQPLHLTSHTRLPLPCFFQCTSNASFPVYLLFLYLLRCYIDFVLCSQACIFKFFLDFLEKSGFCLLLLDPGHKLSL